MVFNEELGEPSMEFTQIHAVQASTVNDSDILPTASSCQHSLRASVSTKDADPRVRASETLG